MPYPPVHRASGSDVTSQRRSPTSVGRFEVRLIPGGRRPTGPGYIVRPEWGGISEGAKKRSFSLVIFPKSIVQNLGVLLGLLPLKIMIVPKSNNLFEQWIGTRFEIGFSQLISSPSHRFRIEPVVFTNFTPAWRMHRNFVGSWNRQTLARSYEISGTAQRGGRVVDRTRHTPTVRPLAVPTSVTGISFCGGQISLPSLILADYSRDRWSAGTQTGAACLVWGRKTHVRQPGMGGGGGAFGDFLQCKFCMEMRNANANLFPCHYFLTTLG